MTVEEIATQILNLRDAEVLVLHVPDTFEDGALTNLRRQLSGLVPEEVQRRASILVLRPGMQLACMTDADLKRMGLQRVKVGA